MPYNYWERDSLLYPHVEASNAERLQTTTNYSISQPHQHFLHSALENYHGDSALVIPQRRVACDRDSATEDQIVDPCNDVHNAGVLLTPTLLPLDQEIAQGSIQSGTAGWHLRHVSSGHSPCAFSDYLSAHNMGFSGTNRADPGLFSPMQGFQHGSRHQFQEEVYPHPRYVVNDDDVGHTFVCRWNDGYGICGRTMNAARAGEHMSSYHFKSPLSADSRLECLWENCTLHKPVRRDTITRHIIEKHLGLKYRCKVWVESPAGASFRNSRKNARLR